MHFVIIFCILIAFQMHITSAEKRLLSYASAREQINDNDDEGLGWLAGRMVHGKDWKYRNYHPARYSYRHGLPQNGMGSPMMAQMQNMMMEMMEMRMMQSMMNRMSENSASSDGGSGCHGHGCSGAHRMDDNELEQYMKDKYGDVKEADMDEFNEKHDKMEQEYGYMMDEFNEYYDHFMNQYAQNQLD